MTDWLCILAPIGVTIACAIIVTLLNEAKARSDNDYHQLEATASKMVTASLTYPFYSTEAIQRFLSTRQQLMDTLDEIHRRRVK